MNQNNPFIVFRSIARVYYLQKYKEKVVPKFSLAKFARELGLNPIEWNKECRKAEFYAEVQSRALTINEKITIPAFCTMKEGFKK